MLISKRLLTFILVFLCSTFSQAAQHTIGILVYDGVLTSDVTASIEVFGAASKKAWFSNYEVVLISANDQDYITSEEGLSIRVDHSINDPLNLDVLLVPSTYDMSPLIANRKLISYIQLQAKQASWLTSNCSGAFLLAEAGLLNGLKATTWAGGEASLQSAYPEVKVQFDQNVVVDQNIITSNGSVVSYQAALLLLEKLSSKSYANEIADSIQWSRLKTAF